jgi:hypothetical protein
MPPLLPRCLATATLSALFENYDEDLKQLVESLKGKLEGDVKALKGGELTSIIVCKMLKVG